MKTFRIKAHNTKTTHYEIEVKANSEEDAYEIAEDKSIDQWTEDQDAVDPRFEFKLEMGDIEEELYP